MLSVNRLTQNFQVVIKGTESLNILGVDCDQN